MFISLKYNDFKGCLVRDVVAILPPWGLAIGVISIETAEVIKLPTAVGSLMTSAVSIEITIGVTVVGAA